MPAKAANVDALLADRVLLRDLGHRTLVRLTQDRDHLRFCKSTLSHDFLSSRKSFLKFQLARKYPGRSVRNDILRAVSRFGRTLWKKWSGYHRRSLVETKMRCFKLLGERVMARDFDRQVADLQIRGALLNRLTHLGTPLTVRVA